MMAQTGRLFMLPVPITDDNGIDTLSETAIRQARELRFFLAENAKSARAFLKKVEHPLPIASLSVIEIGHRPETTLIRDWLKPIFEGHDIGIVSEAGCPGVADPGAQIVAQAHALGVRVVPLVGPSSVLLALMASGLDGQHFRFCGYLPIKEPKRGDTIRDLERKSAVLEGETQLFIETPYRNSGMLADLVRICRPSTQILAAADITGPSESIRMMTAAQWKKVGTALPKLPTVFGVLAVKQRRSS